LQALQGDIVVFGVLEDPVGHGPFYNCRIGLWTNVTETSGGTLGSFEFTLTALFIRYYTSFNRRRDRVGYSTKCMRNPK
jgi:hypothetical protein